MGYPETHWCQTCSFGLARVAIVCALALCKFTSDKSRSTNDAAGYFKWGKFWFGIWKGWEGDQLFLALKKDAKRSSSAKRRAKPNTVNITKSLFFFSLHYLYPFCLPRDDNFVQK